MKSGVNFWASHTLAESSIPTCIALGFGGSMTAIALLSPAAIAEAELRSVAPIPPEMALSLPPELLPEHPPAKLSKSLLPLDAYLTATIFNASPPSRDTIDISLQTVDIDPAIIESSPVLQRWVQEIPDVATDIAHDPAFHTRLRVGYAEFPAANHTGGILIGIQDLFIGQTPLTLSAEYATDLRGDNELIGIDAQYYLLPLGWYGNVAPVVGYRSITTPEFSHNGLNLGLKIILIPSRNGAADLSLTQSWVNPGSADEIGLTTLSIGYAITSHLRIGTDIQTQNTSESQESRVSLLFEWLP